MPSSEPARHHSATADAPDGPITGDPRGDGGLFLHPPVQAVSDPAAPGDDPREVSERTWRAVYESSAVGILLWDTGGRLLAANAVFERMLGHEEAALRRMTLFDLIPLDDASALRADLDAQAAGACPESHAQRLMLRRDGSLLWTQTHVALVPGTDSMAPFFVGIVDDIHQRKLAEKALVESQNALARMTRITAMGELAASIAHEVKQPLGAIATHGDACQRWLAAVPPNIAEALSAAQCIVTDAHRASEVVSRIRAFVSRAEPRRDLVDLADLIAQTLALVGDLVRSRQVLLRTEIAADLPRVSGDRVQLQQVLLNLIMNAIEAMAGVSGRPRSLRVEAGFFGPRMACVKVCDVGPGLSAIDRDRVFAAFCTTKAEGMGIGLTLGRSIVEAHGGRLWATPNDGPGETFQFTLPVAAEGIA